jgi:drug/metabolite transporter (DMT)-like permease
MRLKADLVLLLVAILWGSAFVAQRVAGLQGSVYFFNAARFFLAGLFLLPFASKARIAAMEWTWIAAAGVVLFVASGLQQQGLRTTTAANAGFLTSLYVVLVPLVMLAAFRERASVLSWAAVVIAAVGAFLLSTGAQYRAHLGDLLELGGAAFWSLHVVLLGRYAFRYDAIRFSAGQLLIGSALSWIAGGLFETPPAEISGALVLSTIYTAVASLGLGYTLQVWAQRHTPPTDAALILSLESVIAALAGACLLDERMAPVQVLGCGIIVTAVVLSQASGWSRIARNRRELERTARP